MLKLAKQAEEEKSAKEENAENVGATALQEKTEAAKEDPLRMINAGDVITTVTGPLHVLKGENEAGAVKETATAKKAAALNVEAEVTNNVTVEVAVSAVGPLDLMINLEAVAEKMKEEAEEDLLVTVAVLKIDIADTVEIEEVDLTHLTVAIVEAEESIEEAAHPKSAVEIEDIIVNVELVGLHAIRTPDHTLPFVRLAPDHPTGVTILRKNPDVTSVVPATVTMAWTHPEADLLAACLAEDANAAALKNPAIKRVLIILRKIKNRGRVETAVKVKPAYKQIKEIKGLTNNYQRARNLTDNNQGSPPISRSLSVKNNLQEHRNSLRTTVVTTTERVPRFFTARKHGEPLQSDAWPKR